MQDDDRHLHQGEHGAGRGDGGEEEERRQQHRATRHLREHRGDRDEHQGWPRRRLEAEAEHRGEDRHARQQRHRQVGQHHARGGGRDVLLGGEVAAVGHHRAHADGQLEERQAHGGQHHRGRDLVPLGREQERQRLARSGQRQAVAAQQHQQQEQQRHQPFSGRLNAAGDAQQQDAADEGQHHPLPQQRLHRVPHQGIEAGLRLHRVAGQQAARQGLGHVGKHPGDDLGIERHDQERRRHACHADQPPRRAAGLQLAQRRDGIGARLAADGDLGHHERQADEQRREQVDQQKARATVSPGERGELPDVAQPDGGTQRGGEHAQAGGEGAAAGGCVGAGGVGA